jgi:anti-sigma regulatory factor (Ser/Thr protein kinase)/ActR/RegA family two-component response regulator
MTTANPAPMQDPTADGRGNRIMVIGGETEWRTTLVSTLAMLNCAVEYAAGSADALCRLRRAASDVIITDPATTIEEDLALLEEMRAIRPHVKVIVLASSSTPEAVIAALRAKVFLCRSAPFNAKEIAGYAAEAVLAPEASRGIEILSARPDWVSLRIDCQILTADRLVSFLKELQTGLPSAPREELMLAFHEILMNAIEHGAQFQSDKVVQVAAIHTARAIVFYVRDPGAGFRWDEISHAAVSNPADAPSKHIEVREQQGMRPGGYGILLARGTVDELIYNERGNEVLLIKHVA